MQRTFHDEARDKQPSNNHRALLTLASFFIFAFLISFVSADKFGYGQQSITPQVTVINSQNNTINNTIFTGGNSSFNQSFTDTLYAPIGSTGGNASWNQSFASTLYADIKWGYNMTTPAVTQAFSAANANYSNLTTYVNNVNTTIYTYLANAYMTLMLNMLQGNLTAERVTTNASINNIVANNNGSFYTKIQANTDISGNLTTAFNAANANYTNLTIYVNSKSGGSMDYPYVNNNIVANATNLTTYVNNVNTTIYTYLANAYMTLMLNMLQGNLTAERVTTNSSINNIIQLGNASWSSTSNSSYQLTSTLNTTINQQFQLVGNNNTWSSTYNSSYDSGIKWQYNQSTFPLTNASSTYVPYIGTSTNINIGAHNLTFSQGSNLSSGGSSIWNNGSGWCFGSC